MQDFLNLVEEWYRKRGWDLFKFQQETALALFQNKNGILNAPTGSGKTYAMWIPLLAKFSLNNQPKKTGLKVLWITPLRALAKDISKALNEAVSDFELQWKAELRTGETSSAQKKRQLSTPPQCLVTTPESIHILLSNKGYEKFFSELELVVVDEWHELLGTKRGVQTELALSRLKVISPGLKVWGISATIGNLEKAAEVLLGSGFRDHVLVRSDVEKKIDVETIIPDTVEKFTWAGHLGLKQLPHVVSVIEKSRTTLIFTNTRSQTEIWYQNLIFHAPHLAGSIAIHHGSLDEELRNWVEENLHEGKLKAVVCTSSLDMGVDFRPVETVIQIGGPKGISRFIQRAGRSGHQPGAVSKIYFVPTHSLELIEASALKTALHDKLTESKIPLELSMDVLIQYLLTLAVSGGFDEEKIFEEVKTTYCFRNISEAQFSWVLGFISSGGKSLSAYSEYIKAEKVNGLYLIRNKAIAMRHKLSIGTIVGDPVLKIQYLKGSYIGTVEESFISNLQEGDVFWFAGKNLEFIKVHNMTVLVRKSNKKKGLVPRWMGGRMPLSSQLSQMLREKLSEAAEGVFEDEEMQSLIPLLKLQNKLSVIPEEDQVLIETLESKEGFHIFIFPFEGRYVHQAMASVIAYRISKQGPVTFSIAMNDYGFELLSDQKIEIDEQKIRELFEVKDFVSDLRQSINTGEMARRRFRDIASIAGLVFHGFPGKNISDRHLQASAKLFFDVFTEYEPDNLLVRQAYEEAENYQIEQSRLTEAITRIKEHKLVIVHTENPTPFSFPVMAERFRETLSTEQIEDKIEKLQLKLERASDKK